MQFLSARLPEGAPENWSRQFLLLLGLGALALAAVIFLSKKPYAVLLFMLVVLVTIVAAYPEGSRVIIRVELFSAVAVAAALCFAPIVSGATVLITIAASVLYGGDIPTWGSFTSSPLLADRLGVTAVITASSIMGLLISHLMRKGEQSRKDIAYLEGNVSQLISANVGFQEYERYVDEQSRERERKRITREIHDTIGFTITTVIMLLREAQIHVSDERVREILLNADRQAQEGLAEIRRSLRLLRSIDASSASLNQAIAALARTFQTATGVEVAFESGNVTGPAQTDVSLAVISMIQEGMTNALRHGKANRVRIVLWIDKETLIVNLLDNGRGAVEPVEGIGLAGMRERIAAVGGSLSAESTSEGFCLSARIPVDRSVFKGR